MMAPTRRRSCGCQLQSTFSQCTFVPRVGANMLSFWPTLLFAALLATADAAAVTKPDQRKSYEADCGQGGHLG